MLGAVERRIEQLVASLQEKDISAVVAKIPAGKRLRARLMVEIAGESKVVIDTAAIVEMIHAASLLHDDVIDNASMRRGVASVNATFGNKSAIMIGDILYSKAFYELIDIDRSVAKVISNAVVQLSIGERKDVVMSQSFNANKQEYLTMIYQKTAVLIEAASEAAAILANKKREVFRRYGCNLGLAFQMIDDILDITGSEQILGKPALNDFVEGKTTLPYIYLYEALNSSDKEKLKNMHKRRLNKAELAWIQSKFNEYHIIEKAKKEAFDLIDEAIVLMQQAGEKGLETVATKMVQRSF